MSVLVISENTNNELKSSTLNCITAASKIDKEIHVCVIGNQCEDVVKKVSTVQKVKKILKIRNGKNMHGVLTYFLEVTY